jgi:hypothetical protein
VKHLHGWVFDKIIREEGKPVTLRYFCTGCSKTTERKPQIPAPKPDED